jgi:hypothetical protein
LDFSIRSRIESLIKIVGKTTLLAPLDWGMGHATRSLAIAQQLIRAGVKVIVATPSTYQTFWQQHLPSATVEIITGYNVQYGPHLPAWASVLLQSPHLLKTIRQEGVIAKKLVQKHGADSIISDNRFGFVSKGSCTGIYITNQLFQQIGPLSRFADRIHHHYIREFDFCIVPDYSSLEKSLAGKLTHGDITRLPPVLYIDPISRLVPLSRSTQYDGLLLASGPMPLRQTFTKQLYRYAHQHPEKKFALIAPEATLDKAENVFPFIGVDGGTLSLLFSQSNHLICRSGYSTLMDAHVCGIKEYTLISTPGQPEQAYLAEYWKEKFDAEVVAFPKI